MRSIAMRATLIIAVLLIAGCGDRSTTTSTPTPVPTPTPAPMPMPTLPPNCVRALAEPPADAWPLPATGRLPAAIRVSGGKVYGISIDPATGSLAKKTSTLPFGTWSNVAVTPNGDLAYVLRDHCVRPLRVNGLG